MLSLFEPILNDCMVEFRNGANFDAVWLPRWRRAGVRAYTAKKSKKKVCSDYLFENSCKWAAVCQSVFAIQITATYTAQCLI